LSNELSSDNSGEWRFELRIRYLPSDLNDLYDRDKVTFTYYYDQVTILKGALSIYIDEDDQLLVNEKLPYVSRCLINMLTQWSKFVWPLDL